MRWFAKRRQEGIAEILQAQGFINRSDLEHQFDISTQQASLDLKEFMRANPGRLIYDKSLKRYSSNDGGEKQ